MTTPLDGTVRGRTDLARHAAVDAAHLRLLEKWRKAMDLVGPGPLQPHFDDCRQAIAGLNAAGPWADLGSGAGFPGIALAGMYPDADVVLVESRQKRALFLDKVVAEAKLTNATVKNQRSEDLADGTFVGIVSRAYRPPELVIADAERLLAPHGRLVLLLGSQAEIAVPSGWKMVDKIGYNLSDGARARMVLERT